MSKDDKEKQKKGKKTETIRQRAEKAGAERKPRRITRAGSTAVKPIRAAGRVGRKEFYLPLPNNRFGRFLNKRRRVIPRYFRNAWGELRQVTWPGRKETWKLALAVFVFAIVFGLIISVTDYGLDKLFRKVLIK